MDDIIFFNTKKLTQCTFLEKSMILTQVVIYDKTGILYATAFIETSFGATYQGSPFGFGYCFTKHPILSNYIRTNF